MKILRILFLVSIMLSSYSIDAQVIDTQMLHEDQRRPAQQVNMNLPREQAREYYIDYMNRKYDAKVKGKGFLSNKDILNVEQQNIPEFSSTSMDLYVRFDELDDMNTVMKVTARNGYDLYFSQDYEPAVKRKLADMMQDFRIDATERYYEEQLKEQEDKLDDVRKSQAKAEKTIKKNEKEIAKNLEANEKLKKENIDLKGQVDREAKKLEELRNAIKESKMKLNSN